MVENNDNGWEYCEVCHVHLRSRDLLQAHQQGVQHMRRAYRAGGVPQGQRFRCPVCLVDFDCQNNLHNYGESAFIHIENKYFFLHFQNSKSPLQTKMENGSSRNGVEMAGSSDSDSDIEILATKDVRNKFLVSSERHDIIRCLEDIESQDCPNPSTSRARSRDDISISISKEAFSKAKNVNIQISMEAGDTDTDDQEKPSEDVISIDSGSETEEDNRRKTTVKFNIENSKTGKRKQDCDTNVTYKKIKPNTSSMSTSEILLHQIQSRAPSSSPEPEPVKPVSVLVCGEAFINSCRRILQPNDFEAASKKIMKNLAKLDPAFHHNISLKNFLDSKWSLLDSDPSNIFVHVKDVIEELKKYKGNTFSTTSSGGNTSDPSESENFKTRIPDAPKKRASLTTLSSKPLNKSKWNSLGRVGEDKDELNNQEGGYPGKNKSDDKLLISLSLEKRSSSISKPTSQNKSNIQVFNQTLCSGSDAITSGSSKTVSEKHILKLEKALKACAKEIEKCEEAEIDWDNDDESNFIMADRWKKKFMHIHNKLAEYKGMSKSLERSSDKSFKFSDSKYPEINRKIERFVNKTKTFPDFWDIKKQIEKVNEDNSLRLMDMQIHNEAEKIFIAIGKKLKKRRNIDDGTVMYAYLKPDDAGDPAEKDSELDTKLTQLGKEAEVRINKVFEEFVDKQMTKGQSDQEDNTDHEDKSDEEEINELTLDNIQNNIETDDEDGEKAIENLNSDEEADCELNSSSGSLNDLLDESDDD